MFSGFVTLFHFHSDSCKMMVCTYVVATLLTTGLYAKFLRTLSSLAPD